MKGSSRDLLGPEWWTWFLVFSCQHNGDKLPVRRKKKSTSSCNTQLIRLGKHYKFDTSGPSELEKSKGYLCFEFEAGRAAAGGANVKKSPFSLQPSLRTSLGFCSGRRLGFDRPSREKLSCKCC